MNRTIQLVLTLFTCYLSSFSSFSLFHSSALHSISLRRSTIRCTTTEAIEPNSPKTSEPFVYDTKRIRNFCIIAHIDHGKSTLADRILEFTNTIDKRLMQNQVLDTMDLERERGITIKLQAARMQYTAKDGQTYLLNLIDTPGHVDFGYEVSRSLAACEGALLVVDSTQGVEAQTMANVYLAMESNLEIVPVINKIDLPSSNVAQAITEIEDVIGLDCTNAIPCSAKTGEGVNKILEAIVHHLPPPDEGAEHKPLQALIFDSYYDPYRGVVVYFRVKNGEIRKGDKIKLVNSGLESEVLDLGVLIPPHQVPMSVLRAGEVGYLCANIKAVEEARVGDTITTLKDASLVTALPGYAPVKPMVFAGLYPSESDDYEGLRDAMMKLKLNDGAFSFVPETSSAMGFGFRCGFLGLLHMDIIQERLEREYDLDIIITAPSVVYKILLTDHRNNNYNAWKNDWKKSEKEDNSTEVNREEREEEVQYIDTPSKLPDPSCFREIQEPFVRLEMITPTEFTGPLMELAQQRRGTFQEMKFLASNRCTLIYEMPLAEVITDFFDQLKSRSKGYASMSFQELGYRMNDLVKLTIHIHGEEAPPLATIIHREKAYSYGRIICQKLKDLIPRQQFKIPIQACIGGKSIASTQIGAYMKDVTVDLSGGDYSRKKKLLNKQAKGKKRMKAVGKVFIPQEAFLSVIRMNDDQSNGE